MTNVELHSQRLKSIFGDLAVQVVQEILGAIEHEDNHMYDEIQFWKKVKESILDGKPDPDDMYYIQSGYVGNAMLWWRKDSEGYTTDLREAGRYTLEELSLYFNLRRGEYGWKCSHIDSTVQSHKIVCDGQYLDIQYRIDHE